MKWRVERNLWQPETLLWASSALMLAALTGCASTATQQRAKGGGVGRAVVPRQVGVLQAPGCCEAAEGELVGLRRSLKQNPAIQLRELIPEDQPTTQPAATELLVRDSLDRASRHYLNMKMEHAQQILEYVVRRLRQEGARRVAPPLLARLHLTLGAVYQASGQHDAAQRDFQTAVGIDPQLAPDGDIFSPEIHQAVALARKGLRRSKVTINTTPPAAAVNWNGEARGETPQALEGLPHGDHFLALDRPLYQPWQDQVRISADAQLQIKLKLRPPGQLAAEMIRHPAHRLEAARLLELQHLLVCSPHPEGMAVEVLSPRGQSRQRSVVLTAGGGETGLQKIAALLDQPLTAQPGPSRGSPKKKSSSRTPWIIASVAAAVGIALAVIIPLSLSSSSDGGRPVTLKLP